MVLKIQELTKILNVHKIHSFAQEELSCVPTKCNFLKGSRPYLSSSTNRGRPAYKIRSLVVPSTDYLKLTVRLSDMQSIRFNNVTLEGILNKFKLVGDIFPACIELIRYFLSGSFWPNSLDLKMCITLWIYSFWHIKWQKYWWNQSFNRLLVHDYILKFL